jgi:metallo-beta-lactamase class B
MKATEGSKTYDVVIIGSTGINGNKLVNNALYPRIAEDYEQMFRVLKSLPCDFFLGSHGSFFGLVDKYPLLKEGKANPFIDPDGYKKFVVEAEQDFAAELAKQKASTR